MRLKPLWRLVPGAVLVLAAWSSAALTVGRAQGNAVIGRPLDISIPVGLDAMDSVADLCPAAEVFYGETRVNERRVELVTSDSRGGAGRVRVRVSSPVNEAFVSVVLSLGCGQTFTRRFELLTEEPADLAEAAAVPTPVALAPSTLVKAAPLPPAPPRATPAIERQPVAAAPAAAPAPAPVPAPRRSAAPKRAPAPKPPPKPAPPVKPEPAAAAQAPAERPRLKLDAVDVRMGGESPLKVSRSLQGTGTATVPQRTEAAAAWQALNTAPEELLRNAQRMQSLELDIRALRDGMLKSEAQMIELRNRLERSERERYANGLVYALASLLVAVGGLAGFLWYRGRHRQPSPSAWWIDSQQSLAESVPLTPDAQAAAAPFVRTPGPGVAAPKVPEPAWAEAAPVQASPVAVPLPMAAPAEAVQAAAGVASALETGQISADRARPTADAAFAHAFVPSGSQALRVSEASMLQAADLAQLQDRVDALRARGDVDAAMALLRQHLDAHPQASTLGWLNLLDLLHGQRRAAEYEQLRHDYEWLFNTKAPAFDAYAPGNAGLEAHRNTLAEISAQWPAPAALAWIGDALFKRPASADEAFDLESLRDLLLLHAVGQDLAAHPASAHAAPAPVSSTDAAAIAPALAPDAAPALAAAAVPLVPAVPELDLSLPLMPELDLPLSLPDAGPEAAPLADDPEAGHILDLAGLELDLNLDELDPGAAPMAASQAPGNSNLLDFDLDLGDSYPLPGSKR